MMQQNKLSRSMISIIEGEINSNKMTLHYLYKITNIVTGHFYYGAHSTRDMNDGYMGSGVLIKKAVRYYGVNSFNVSIIGMYSDRKALFKAERRLITKEIITDPNCYNLITGGKRKSKNTIKVLAKTKNCKELLTKRKIK